MIKFFKKKSKNNIIVIIVLAVVFGLLGGIVGQLFSKAYLLNGSYQIPYWGEIDFPNNGAPNGSLVISGARKVVVEQDMKLEETISSAQSNIVGIFRKQIVDSASKDFDINNYYQLNEERGQGLVITSDGWIMTSAFSPNIRTEDDILTNYVVINKEGKIYEIDQLVRSPQLSFGFIHLDGATDLSVSSFVDSSEIKNGHLVIALNWDNDSLVSFIIGENNLDLIESSDYNNKELLLADNISDKFYGATLFDLTGGVVGAIDNTGVITPINSLKAAVNSLLEYQDIKTASLGVNYINLAELITEDSNNLKGAIITKNINGISIVKGSAADTAGLEEGDIILFINNLEVNKDNDLNEILNNYLAGDSVLIKYLRDGSEKEITVLLDELE